MAHSRCAIHVHGCYAQEEKVPPVPLKLGRSVRQDWEAKPNLSRGFPCPLLASSGHRFFPVCLLEHTLPRSAPSAYELSQTSYLLSPLKNRALKVMVTHAHFHQRLRGLCALPLMLLYSFDNLFLSTSTMQALGIQQEAPVSDFS